MDRDEWYKKLDEGFHDHYLQGDFGVPIFARRTRLWQAEEELARLVDDVVKNRNRPEEN